MMLDQFGEKKSAELKYGEVWNLNNISILENMEMDWRYLGI